MYVTSNKSQYISYGIVIYNIICKYTYYIYVCIYIYISDLLVGCHALSPVFSTSLAFCGPCHLGVSSVDLNSVPMAGAKSTGAPNKKGTPNWAKDRQSNVAEKLYVYCPWPRQPTTFSLQNHMSTKKYQLYKIYIHL